LLTQTNLYLILKGTGKTLSARAVANRTDACFIRVIGSELVQKYVGEGARMVRELFTMARSKRACIVFFDEIDAIGGARTGSDENGSDNEVQRTMLQIVTELDGFDARGNIKVLMATNRPDTLDPALLRPGRLDRKVEFGLPDLEGRGHILKIHSKRMNCDRDIRFELIARLCPNTTGAELHSVCTEAGMYAIRARRKSVSEKDFLDSVNKVVKGYKKFSSTPKYMVSRQWSRIRIHKRSASADWFLFLFQFTGLQLANENGNLYSKTRAWLSQVRELEIMASWPCRYLLHHYVLQLLRSHASDHGPVVDIFMQPLAIELVSSVGAFRQKLLYLLIITSR